MIYNEESFYFMLQEIRKRPGMYLGEKSLKSLMNFWHGYDFGIGVKNFEYSTGKKFFENYVESVRSVAQTSNPYNQHFMYGFDQFVHLYYNVNMGSMNGMTLILQKSNSEAEAFDKFFELYDEFLMQK